MSDNTTMGQQNLAITDEQKEILRAAMNQDVSEKELCKKLGLTEEQYTELVTGEEAERKKVFEQVLSEAELADISGGFECLHLARKFGLCGLHGSDDDGHEPRYCTDNWRRNIDAGEGFPNCAATVEENSWCGSNDACVQSAVIYYPLYDCSKAFR